MNRTCTSALLTLVSATFAAPISAATLSVELGLASIPSSITLCRDAAAISAFPVDHQWQIGFDLDGNTSTGAPVSGNEAVLIVQTLTQSLPCAPQAVPAVSAFETGVLRWNASSGQFETAGPATVIVDVPNGRLRMSFDSSVLPAPGLGSTTGIDATSFTGYSSSGVMYATDGVPRFTRGTSPSITVSDPANDVTGCMSLCSTASSWYPLVDMRSLQIGAAIVPVSVELGLASIPSSVTLCRDAAAINAFPVDHQWQIGFDLDGNTSTGAPVSGNEAVLIVQTLTQSLPCAPQAVPAVSAFETGVLRWNASSGQFETAGPATVIVDMPNGRLRMSFDSSVLPAPGLGSTTGIDATSFTGYSSSGVMYATDGVPRFTRGMSPSITVSDPANDVAGCVSPCSTASSWYPLVDMRSLQIGAATDLVFSSGFE